MNQRERRRKGQVLIDDVHEIKPDRIQITPDDGAFYLDVLVAKYGDAAAILNLLAWMTSRCGVEVASVDYTDGELSVHVRDA